MSATPQTNVVAMFDSSGAAEAAAEDLRRSGFRDGQIGVSAEAGRTLVNVAADDRHAEAAVSLERNGGHDVQRVAR